MLAKLAQLPLSCTLLDNGQMIGTEGVICRMRISVRIGVPDYS
jgi:hypothetical protein